MGTTAPRPRVLLLIKGLGLGGAERLLVDVVTLDTGRLFPETYELWARTERRYRRRIRAFCPDRAGKPLWPWFR